MNTPNTLTLPTPEEARAELMEALKFNTEDLQANRAGNISPRQKARLQRARRRDTLIGAAVVLGLLVVCVLLLFFGSTQNNSILRAIGLGLVVCNAALTGLFARNWLKIAADLRYGQTDALTGPAQHVVRQLGRAITYSVRVGEQVEISLSLEAFTAFRPGELYTLYRAAHSGTILSVEPQSGAF